MLISALHTNKPSSEAIHADFRRLKLAISIRVEENKNCRWQLISNLVKFE